MKKIGYEAGAVALLLGEPFFIKHLYRVLETALIECTYMRCLPKDHSTLAALLQLLVMAESAPNMYSTGIMEVPAITPSLVRNVAAKLVYLQLQVSIHVHGGLQTSEQKQQQQHLLRSPI